MIRNLFHFNDKIVKVIDDRTITIIPTNLGITQGYYFKFKPLPIYQTYQAYTVLLDRANAKVLYTANYPRKILLSFCDINRRYPFFFLSYYF